MIEKQVAAVAIICLTFKKEEKSLGLKEVNDWEYMKLSWHNCN